VKAQFTAPAIRRRTFLLALALCTGVLLMASPLVAQTTNWVRAGNYFYDPPFLTIQAGGVVTWTNVSGTQHDSHQGTNLWDGPLMNIGETWSFTFTNAGFYPYYCTPHVGRNQTGSVTVASAPVNLPPLVSLDAPVSGSSYTAPARITLQAGASDPDGTVAKVEFMANGTKLGEATSPPYRLTWDNVAAGIYSLVALATDNVGARSTSGVVQVTVAGAVGPEVTITSPTNGSVIPAPGSFDLAASVARNAATQVEFFAGTTSLGLDTTNPYRLSVDNLPPGTYTLSAVATDANGNKGTNSVVVTVNLRPVVQFISPADGAGFLAPGGFVLEAAASDADGTVSDLRFFRGTTFLATVPADGAALVIQGLAAGTYVFTATATDNLGSQSSQSIEVIVKARPTLAVTTPAANARLTDALALFSGTAADSVRVSAVEYSVNGGPFQPASGTTSWNRSAALPPGTNQLRFRSLDAFGHSSLTNARSVFQVSPSTLTLEVFGQGTISGATNGQPLEIGRGYQVTAVPAPGYLFSNWTGQVSGELPRLPFLMQPNLVLQANFVPNPFLRVSGSFHGLFSEETTVRHATSGEFRLNVAVSGKYSATLRLAGQRYAASGVLDLTGRATNTLLRTGASPLIVRWVVNLQGLDEVTGSLTDGAWTASLLGVRAAYNARTNRAPLAGKHTLVLEGSRASTPTLGDGWGTLVVNPAGVARLAGSLADGTRVTRAAPLSKNGDWPLYAGLYANQGSLLGWVRFNTNAPADDFQGRPWWFRPPQPTSPLYPEGFAQQPRLIGSRYLAPIGFSNNMVALTNASLVLAGGNLSQTWTSDIILGPNHRVTNSSPHPLTVTLSPGNGLFRGTFTDTVLGRTVPFTGALLQKSARGAGWFPGTNVTGQVLIEPRRP
jgi:plastocyanin